MKTRTPLRMAVLLVILAPALASGPAPAAPGRAATVPIRTNLRWLMDYVDIGGDAGAYPSIAFDPHSGSPWISYYDASHTALKVAFYTDSNGNCGPADDWYCMTADNSGNVGTYSSIDFYYGNQLDWKAGVAYYDAGRGALKYAQYTCVLLVCFWDIVTVQDADYLGAPSYGQYAALKFDDDGTPLIAYYVDSVLFADELRYAHRVPGGGNCGLGDAAGLWQCDMVDSGTRVGQYAALDYSSFEDKPYIAYYDAGAGNLKYAYYAGIGNCGSGNQWYCATLDGTDGSDVGQSASLRAPESVDDELQLAYYDATHETLRYADHLGGGGNCGPGSSFRCVDIEITEGGPHAAIALTVDGSNLPIIAYGRWGPAAGQHQLKVAQPALAQGLAAGNCGPEVPLATWQCTVVDGGSAEQSEAAFVSIALGPGGLAAIAYSEWATLFDTSDLKVAYQRPAAFLPLVLRRTL